MALTSSDKQYLQDLFHTIHGIVTNHLRDLFKKEWDQRYPNMLWTDDDKSLHDLMIEEKKYIHAKAKVNFKYLKGTGDRHKWDITALCQVLLYSSSLSLLARKSRIYYFVDQLRLARNDIMHNVQISMSKVEYQHQFNHVKNCLIKLGCHKAVNELQRLDQKKHAFFTKAAIIPIFVLFVGFLVKSTLRSMDDLNPEKFYFPETKKTFYFQGRDAEILEISSCMVNGSFRIINVVGMPAIGKTSTAVAVGKLLKDRFHYRVTFVDFHNIISYNDILQRVVGSIAGKSISTLGEKEMLHIISRYATDNSTLILDNVEDAILDEDMNEAFRSFLDDVVTNSAPTFTILCTSRKRFEIIGIPTANIQLQGLDLNSSVVILKLYLQPMQVPFDHLLEIARSTGGVPLLLELVGSHLRSRLQNSADLMSTIKEHGIFVAVEDMEDMTEKTNPYKLINILFEKINPSHKKLFVSVSVFERPFTIELAVNVTEAKSQLACRKNLGHLRTLNLLEDFTGGTGDTRYAIHPVLRSYAFYSSMKDERLLNHWKAAHQRMETYQMIHSKLWENLVTQFSFILQNFDKWDTTRIVKFKPEAKESVIELFRSTAESLTKIGDDLNLMTSYVMYALLNLDNRTEFYKRSLSISQNVLGSHTITASLKFYLAFHEYTETVNCSTVRFTCNGFNESYHMFKSLVGNDIRTYRAAAMTAVCMDQIKYASRDVNPIPFYEAALKVQRNTPELQNCTKCSIFILYKLALLKMPSEAFLKFPCYSLIAKYLPSLSLLQEALEVIENADIIPVPKHDKHINVIDCQNEFKFLPIRTFPFNASDYCIVHNVILKTADIYRSIGDFDEVVITYKMLFNLHTMLDLRFSAKESAPFYICLALKNLVIGFENIDNIYQVLQYLQAMVLVEKVYEKTAETCNVEFARNQYAANSEYLFINTCIQALDLYKLIDKTHSFYICSHCEIHYISSRFESIHKKVLNFSLGVTITGFKNTNFKTFVDEFYKGGVKFKCPPLLHAYGGTWDKNGKYEIFLNTTYCK